MNRTAATVIAIAAFAAPAPALAAPMMAAPVPSSRSVQAGTATTGTTTPVKLTQNDISDRRALNAYATYLTALINQQPVGQTNVTSYIDTISQPGAGGCKAALAKLTQPPYQVDTKAQHTLTVLGEEIGDDVTINFDLSATEAFTRFSGVLRNLRWTRISGASLVIKRYINAQTNMLAQPQSNLCLDASDAELHPDIVPDGTKLFLPAYNLASSKSNLALTSLTTLMQTYEISSEKALVARIAALANELSTQTKADLLQSGTALTTVLESS
jgi:hypothetical protein